MNRRVASLGAIGAVVGTALVWAGPAPAGADTVSQARTLAAARPDWDASVVIDRFDPARGQLTRVELQLHGSVAGSVAYENLDPLAAVDASATVAARLTVRAPSGTDLASVVVAASARDTLDPFDGTVDHDGASGRSRTGLADDQQVAVVITDPAALAAFVGTGTLALPVHATDLSSAAPAGLDAVLDLGAGAAVTVDYVFTPDDRPPDPPTITASPPANTNVTALTWAFDAEPGSRPECRVVAPDATGDWSSCTSPSTTDVRTGPDGSYVFSVRTTDAAGNVSGASTSGVVVDRLAPAAPAFTSEPASPTADAHPVWRFVFEPGSTGRCVLDGAPAVPCAGSFGADLGAAPDGLHQLVVTAVDAAGNVGPAATGRLVLDRVAPAAPTLLGVPASPGADPTPTWTIGGDADATLVCTVDGRPGTACPGTYTADLTAAADGAHTLVVVAVDAVGNTSPATSTTYVLDRVGPGAPQVTGPASPSNDPRPAFTFVAEVDARAECRVDAGDWTACAGGLTVDLTQAADGVHTLSVRAIDAAGNVGAAASVGYTLDRLAPGSPTVTSSPATASPDDTPTWTFSAERGATTACSVDGGPFAACDSPFTADLTAATDGRHTFGVRATDAAGNTGAATTVHYVLDRTAPHSPTITAAPASPGRDPRPVWRFDTPADATAECRVDSGPFVPCAGSLEADLTGAADGPHRIVIRARDAAGNSSPNVDATYELDRVSPARPQLTSTPTSPGAVTTPGWTFTVEPGATATCAVDGGAAVACAGSFTADLGALPDGRHDLAIVATDAAGNASEAATSSYELDTTPPAAPVLGGGPGGASADDTPTWSVEVDPTATAECRVDDGAWSPCAGTFDVDLTEAPDGTHGVEVRAVDAVGNVSPVVAAAYVLDRVAPRPAEFVNVPASPGSSATPTWSFRFEPGTEPRCSLDGDVEPCDGAFTPDLGTAGDGAHVVGVTVVDEAGNASPTVERVYVLDRIAPAAPVVVPPRSPGNDPTPTWALTVAPDAGAECAVDGAAPVPCATWFTADVAGDGLHVLVVVARDLAGNASAPVRLEYLLDTVAPAIPTISALPTAAGWAWSFGLEAGAAGECSVDGGPWQPCAGSVAASAGARESRLDLRAVDAAGNRSAVVTSVARRSEVVASTIDPVVAAALTASAPTPVAPRDVVPAVEVPLAPAAVAPGAAVVAGPTAAAPADRPVSLGPLEPPDPVRRSTPEQVAAVLNAAVEHSTVPVLLIVSVILFLAVQDRVDRRDPKLAHAPVRSEPEYVTFR